jgi:hypothetical protein
MRVDMRKVLYTLALAAASLLLIAGFVFGGHDRSMFVPAPEAAAEGFAREIATRRYDMAMNYLALPARRAETARTLASRFERLLASTGTINQVDAAPKWMMESRASARATIEGDTGRVSFELGFIRENGLWRIDQLPDLVR